VGETVALKEIRPEPDRVVAITVVRHRGEHGTSQRDLAAAMGLARRALTA